MTEEIVSNEKKFEEYMESDRGKAKFYDLEREREENSSFDIRLDDKRRLKEAGLLIPSDDGMVIGCSESVTADPVGDAAVLAEIERDVIERLKTKEGRAKLSRIMRDQIDDIVNFNYRQRQMEYLKGIAGKVDDGFFESVLEESGVENESVTAIGGGAMNDVEKAILSGLCVTKEDIDNIEKYSVASKSLEILKIEHDGMLDRLADAMASVIRETITSTAEERGWPTPEMVKDDNEVVTEDPK